MLIEKEKIQEAKEKLGDRNAELIVEILDVKDYDERNKKAPCPFHHEDHASWIYNPKKYCFHCFGACGKNTDIIDALMSKGMNYLDACEELFKIADIPYAFGEKGVKTRSQYRYPKEIISFDNSQAYAYLKKRGISQDIADECDIRQDEYGNIVFNYYDLNNVLTMVKYRPSHKVDPGHPKMWFQKDTDNANLLWHMNKVNPREPLLICEGEIDLMAAMESGYKNVVSVSNGAGTFKWIETCWEFLEQFDSIIIASDNDEAGMKMRKECIYRLGSWRTKVMDIPETYTTPEGKTIHVSDINEMMYWYGKDAVLDAIIHAKDTPIPDVESFGDVDEVSIYDMDGVETGFNELDKELIKLFYGTLTIISGRPGSGKSSMVNQLIAEAIDNQVPVFLYSQEMMNSMLTNWFNLNVAGVRHIRKKITEDGKTFYFVDNEAKNGIKEWAKDYLYLYKDDAPNGAEEIMKTMEDCVRKMGVKLIVLDNLMMIDLKCDTDGTNKAQTDFVNDLIAFSRKYNVAVILVAHPKKTAEMQSDIGMYDIAGSSNIINLAMRSIGLRRVSKREKEDMKSEFGKYNVVLTIMKDRILGKADVQIGLFYDIQSRRFFTNYDEYARQYCWDSKIYDKPIPIPECLINKADKEVFGEEAG